MGDAPPKTGDIPDAAKVPSYLNAKITLTPDILEGTITPKLPDQIPTGEEEPEQEKPFVLPIYVYTAIFGAIFILGPFLVRRGPNKSITRCCIMLSAFCCWIFWTTTYIVQMNPLLGPRLSNATVAWIGYKWGKDPRYCVTNEDKEAEAEAKAEAEADAEGSAEPGKKTAGTDEKPADTEHKPADTKEKPPDTADEKLPGTGDEKPLDPGEKPPDTADEKLSGTGDEKLLEPGEKPPDTDEEKQQGTGDETLLNISEDT